MTTGIASLRISELRRIFRYRYGRTLPDDDAGRDDLRLALHHAAELDGDPRKKMRNFASVWARWIRPDELDEMIEDTIRWPQRWSADELADRLGLTEAERTKLAIRTIGVAGVSKAEREKLAKARRRQRDRERRKRKRAAAARATRGRPWEADGSSRATWYRHRANGHKPWLWDNSPRAEALRCVLVPGEWKSATEVANKVATWGAFRNLGTRSSLMKAVHRGLDELKKAGRIEDRHEHIDGRDVRFVRSIVVQ